MKRAIEFLPEISWSEVFLAVDTLSCQGAITLECRGFENELRGRGRSGRANSLILLSKPPIDLITVLP